MEEFNPQELGRNDPPAPEQDSFHPDDHFPLGMTAEEAALLMNYEAPRPYAAVDPAPVPEEGHFQFEEWLLASVPELSEHPEHPGLPGLPGHPEPVGFPEPELPEPGLPEPGLPELPEPELPEPELPELPKPDFPEPELPTMPRGRNDSTPATTATPTAEMASATASISGVSNSTAPIPLFCMVCPNSPRFSDVSHLLTHIASKGHLHHETQTRLKAHQDIAASVAVREYEQWYRQHGIEGLLVERMRAKQAKEAAKSKRNRASAATASKVKKKARRVGGSGANGRVETEAPSDYPLFPLFNSDHEVGGSEEYGLGNDSLSLKGQVWPGMGKIDLADEEMKRTRNQRKPKSAIDRMRRTSEGIEPTQVVMSLDFEVERIKGVYDDSSSPIPGQEESTPPRKTRSKRKRADTLVNLPVNVPLRRQSTRTGLDKEPSRQLHYGLGASQGLSVPVGALRERTDVFRDDSMPSTTYDHRAYTVSNQDPRFGDRMAMPALNPISHSNLASPTPSARGIAPRMFSSTEGDRGRPQHQAYMNAYHQVDGVYSMNEASLYGNHARSTMYPSAQFEAMAQDHFRLSPETPSMYSKPEDLPNSAAGEALQGPAGNSPFLGLSGTNPLLSQDRMFLNAFAQTPAGTPHPSLTFTPINRGREPGQAERTLNAAPMHGSNVKVDGQPRASIEANVTSDDATDGMWRSRPPSAGIDLAGDLDSEHLQI